MIWRGGSPSLVMMKWGGSFNFLCLKGWMDERCFRPLLCTVKSELGRGQPGLMRWIWDETLPQSSIDRSTFYSAAHRATKWASGCPLCLKGDSLFSQLLLVTSLKFSCMEMGQEGGSYSLLDFLIPFHQPSPLNFFFFFFFFFCESFKELWPVILR